MANEYVFEDSNTAFEADAARRRALVRGLASNPPLRTRRMQTTPSGSRSVSVPQAQVMAEWLVDGESWRTEEEAAMASRTARMAVNHRGDGTPPRYVAPAAPRAGTMSFGLDGEPSFSPDEYTARYLPTDRVQRVGELVHTAALDDGASVTRGSGRAAQNDRARLKDGQVLLRQVSDGLHLNVWSHGKRRSTRKTDALRAPEIFTEVMACDERVTAYVFATLGRLQQAMARAVVQCARAGVQVTACQLYIVARDALIDAPEKPPVGVEWEF